MDYREGPLISPQLQRYNIPRRERDATGESNGSAAFSGTGSFQMVQFGFFYTRA
jgi:hypothetical protein